MISFKDIEEKWQKRWYEQKLFEADPDNRPKFFANAPYPYINAYPHIGHLYTFMRSEAFSRYKRLKGYNVLFPQGWHATGSPIVLAAKRVKEREPKQIKIMADMGIIGDALLKFEDPKHWITFFAPEFKKDFKRMGFSIDWRREFHTTDLNPHYDAFVRWQMRKLKEKGYVIKGKFPVVWDPKENCAIGDHDRTQGEGEVPQEFCLVKHKLFDGTFIVTATLRQDTILGITNLYIHPDIVYAKADVHDEKWIVSESILPKLALQEYVVKKTGTIKGIELVGKEVEVFGGRSVLILPATFIDPVFGTGIVHSVPSDSADDLIALHDLQKDDARIAKYSLDAVKVKAIKPIGVLHTQEYGDIPAQVFLDKYGVKNQNEREKLDKIKQELYKLSFYTATFNHLYKNVFSENLEGVQVQKGKEIIKRDLLSRGVISLYYQLTGKVVSRSLTECVVKIVNDQWFVDYANPTWKKTVHECLKGMHLYTEKSRLQFEYVIDWLHEWACTREEGLGTRLPWDEKWLIESLSDSTVYMAYYTVAHLVKELPLDQVNDVLFDYVFLGKGEKPKIPHIDKMRRSFDYYYPFDFRNSGKDLIQNHMTFCLFNHVAIFPKEKWPKGFGLNGWVMVDGQKMSKSLGNMIPLRDMAEQFSADASRITILNGGEDMDDPNWDTDFARSIGNKLSAHHAFLLEHFAKHQRKEERSIDAWFVSETNRIIRDAERAMDETLFRTAIQLIYFEFSRLLRSYLTKTNNDPHASLFDEALKAQIVMLSPFTPHICEEMWESIGQKGFVSVASWPAYDASKIDEKLVLREQYISQIMDDITTVKGLAKLEHLRKVTVFVTEPWKYDLYALVKKEMDAGNRDFKLILSKIMADAELRKQGPAITKLLPLLIKKDIALIMTPDEEFSFLTEMKSLIEAQHACTVEVIKAKDSGIPKAKQASPGKPAIVVE